MIPGTYTEAEAYLDECHEYVENALRDWLYCESGVEGGKVTVSYHLFSDKHDIEVIFPDGSTICFSQPTVIDPV